MFTSPDGVELIHHFETCVLTAYPDPRSPLSIACRKAKVDPLRYTHLDGWRDYSGDPWSIGWGSTGADIVPGLVWTQEQADRRFSVMLSDFEEMVAAAVTAPLVQHEFDALVSIVYNVGPGSSRKDGIIRLRSGRPSTLLRMLNELDYEGAAEQFIRWVSPGSNVEAGLRRRRRAETAMFRGDNWRRAA